ncbi:unnamed protein product [Lactuca virosa]|uniref:Uncharacterized protein n=1 Tax=Lactuca virosa TaxID=75947 RepID=A0AAU9NSL8_9ASTR|nr:unnamed protein product [Lactuca virosa]
MSLRFYLLNNTKRTVSPFKILRVAIDFFNNISHRPNKIMAVLKENHKFRSYELDAFGRNIKLLGKQSVSTSILGAKWLASILGKYLLGIKTM